MTRTSREKRAIELLKMVGISDGADRLKDYPFQFSGACASGDDRHGADLSRRDLIADEPTTALDVTIQARSSELVKDLRKNLAWRSSGSRHDLGIIAGLAQPRDGDVRGCIVERAKVEELYERPCIPTRAAC